MIEFKPIPSCPGYQASACGQIKGKRGSVLKCYLGLRGYLTFRIPTGGTGKSKSFYVHRAVAEAWGLDIDNKVVNHVDHNKLNNCFENLKICTQADNLKACVNYYGKQPNQKYFIKEQLLALALKNKGLSNRSIAKQIGCSKNTVKNLLNKTWQLKA